MNGKFFEVPTKIFDAMSKADQWAANKTFLDRAISRGQSFNLATPFDAIRPGSFLEEEVNYLMNEAHYVLNELGTMLIPPEV